MDGRMESDQGIGHGIACGVGIEAAVDLAALGEEGRQPAWVGSGAGGGEATVLGMEGEATEGIDGRLTEDEGGPRGGRNGEEAEVFLRAWSQAPPLLEGGAAQFGPDGPVFFSQQQEDGVGSTVGIKSA